MSLAAAVKAKLGGDAGVSALVGTRVSPSVRPQGDVYPALTYFTASRDPVRTIGAAPSQWEAVVQVSCWAKTYLEAEALAEAVVTAVDRQVGPWGNLTVRHALVAGYGAEFDEDAQCHVISLQVDLVHE